VINLFQNLTSVTSPDCSLTILQLKMSASCSKLLVTGTISTREDFRSKFFLFPHTLDQRHFQAFRLCHGVGRISRIHTNHLYTISLRNENLRIIALSHDSLRTIAFSHENLRTIALAHEDLSTIALLYENLRTIA